MSGMHRNRVRPEIKKKKRLSFQRVMQLLSAVFFNGYVIGFQKGKIFTGGSKAVCVPVLNCYSCPGALGACPIGSLQAVLGHRRIPFYVLGLLMLFGVTLGRVVCGLLCPFGFVQDLLHKIPLPKVKVPKKIDRPARYLKYMILLFFVILLPAFVMGKSGISMPWFCKYICPAGTLGGGVPQMLLNPELRNLAGMLFSWKVLVLAVIVAASIIIPRPFCRYLCPLGAFYSLFNRFSFYQMQLDKSRCVGCRKCEQACPMAVEVTKDIRWEMRRNADKKMPATADSNPAGKTRGQVLIHSPECIRCGKCKSLCPTGAITSGFTVRFSCRNRSH